VSPLATAPGRASSGSPPPALDAKAQRPRTSVDVKLGTALAALLILAAFLTGGGTDLGPNTLVQVALVILAAAVAASVLLRGVAGRAWGGVPLTLFIALAALTCASIAWSVQPSDSWLEANRTLSYLASFAAAIGLARLMPGRWPALLGAVAVMSTAVCAYALLVKVFPATFAPNDLLGRLSAPFDYWNATGLVAALGLPACLWAGARRDRGRALRALAVPAVAILVAALVLSYSRGAVLAAIVGLAFWFAVVPLRLRATLVLALGSAAGAVIAGWALSTHTFAHDQTSLAARTTTGHAFGIVLVLVLAVATVIGFAAAFAMDRVPVRAELRRQIAIVLLSAVALVPLGGVVALAASSRGLTGEVSHVWHTLTTANSGVVGDVPSRLTQLGNTRPTYWSEALKVGEHSLLKGTGALGFGTASLRYAQPSLVATHAHGYAFETFADFGLIGIAVNLALLVAWSIAAARAVDARLPARLLGRAPPLTANGGGPEGTPVDDAVTADGTAKHAGRSAELAGLLTMLAIVLIFGVHSAIDWTWFVPGCAIPALICAGWLAGRGPLRRPVVRSPSVRPLGEAPGTYGAVVLLATGALAISWLVWQPLRAVNADTAAVAAITNGRTDQGLADARSAVARNPLSIDPLFELSAIYSAIGDAKDAHAQLAHGVSVQPQNPFAWQQLGEYDLQRHQPLRALHVLRVALRLYPSSTAIRSDIAQAKAALLTLRAR
jgi:hypothetical protein